MRIAIAVPVALSALLAGSLPAFAISCKEEIATIERRLNSSGAAEVTKKEPPGGTTSSDSAKALDKPPSGKPSDPAVQPSAAGVEEARKLIDTARSQEKAGQEQACQDTMTKAKQKAGALP
ncbi:hypothetical protein [Methylobacterium gnaphalii]|uniref:Uncharacterized protein n=1 Tax=Methylobacterium gnaphalii TaxID=1010610 RepID=A0A512JF93_9HYPH|nr:hypothetical protein [Methylobacterium gnaphalii]GEP08617.1 hypothetical protein MGN01_04620 [Methylobacterium gnaphalii]GJD71230.1 hypothetical protein MMMDOFMJ_4184 [Methylobacterium gnaphalii]GLS50834.1 hypothetical protein GCM10007885_36880 [Methylobacterium gnaphalii]